MCVCVCLCVCYSSSLAVSDPEKELSKTQSLSELRHIMLFNPICNDGTKNCRLTKSAGELETFFLMNKILYIEKFDPAEI